MVTRFENSGTLPPLGQPDIYSRQLPTEAGMAWLDTTIWWGTESNGTVIYVRRSDGSDPDLSGDTQLCDRWVNSALEFGRRGLEPTMDTLGIRIQTGRLADSTDVTGYTLSTPPTRELINRANAQQYTTPGRRMQFEGSDRAFYTVQEFFEALAEGHLIIPLTGMDPRIPFHDVADHMIVGLALSSELVGLLAQRARYILDNPQEFPEFFSEEKHESGKNLLNTFDHALFSTHFLDFLDGDDAEVARWAALLGTDDEAARGYAVRARDELRQLQPIEQAPRPIPRPHGVLRRIFLG